MRQQTNTINYGQELRPAQDIKFDILTDFFQMKIICPHSLRFCQKGFVINWIEDV